MNKKILLSSALALTISLAPISSAKAMDSGLLPPSGPIDDNGSPTSRYDVVPKRVEVSINSEDSVKVGEPIKFESGISDIPVHRPYVISYSWDFGDGNTSSNSVTSHVFNEPGIYTVKLKIDGWKDPGCFGRFEKYFGETTKTIIVE
ncbi:PKD domain-containing protein [uncultured Clostridium sp.]|uniref:PKD domain-containing protein n=1 Tax=uncultured Clostridium sp. TaxID=59620 RepID=UPI003216A891